MNQRGFTLIEFVITLVIVVMLVQFVMVLKGFDNSNISFGVNGITEVRCIDGYKFVIGDQGHARQILDEFGKGAKCDKGM